MTLRHEMVRPFKTLGMTHSARTQCSQDAFSVKQGLKHNNVNSQSDDDVISLFVLTWPRRLVSRSGS